MPTLRRSAHNITTTSLSLRTLIIESWRTFIRDSKETFSISIWFIAPALLLLLITLLNTIIPDTFGVLLLMGVLTSFCVQAWVSLRLIRVTLTNAGVSIAKPSTIQGDVFAYLWIKLLYGIAIIGALLPLVLGLIGLPLFITLTRIPELFATYLLLGGGCILAAPALWLSIHLFFGPYLLVGDLEGVDKVYADTKGQRWVSLKRTIDLLVQSYTLVQKRFWYTLARLVIPGLLFGLLMFSSISIIDTLIQFIAGPEKIASLFGPPGSAFLDIKHATGNSYSFFLQSMGEALFLPLFIVSQTKLFLSLRRVK